MGYAGNIQKIENNVGEFATVASGTVTIGVGVQFIPMPINIPRPKKVYRNYVLLAHNKSGQVLNGVSMFASSTKANDPVPNTPAGQTFKVKDVSAYPTIPNNNRGGFDVTSEEPNPFVMDQVRFDFNLTAVTTVAGSIDWALIGY